MSEVIEKHRVRQEDIPCEGKCGFVVSLVDNNYVIADKSKKYYGMYVKDELKSAVCLDCYDKGVRLKTG